MDSAQQRITSGWRLTWLAHGWHMVAVRQHRRSGWDVITVSGMDALQERKDAVTANRLDLTK